jgi:hypothetical protein
MAMMRIYYLGGLNNIPPGEEQGFDITSGQEVFRCPPIGEFIEVPDYVARDIMGKYGFDKFNTSAQLATRAKRGTLRFEKSEENGRTMIHEVLSDEEILARAKEIEKQRASLKVEPEEKESEEEVKAESADEDEEEKKPTSRRSKKKEASK